MSIAYIFCTLDTMSICFSAKPHPSQVATTEDSGKLIYCTSYIYQLHSTHT